MRSFQERLGDFETRGVRIAAISVDPPETSRHLARTQGYIFALLSDPASEAIRRYDLVHEKAGPGGTDISRPAEFLIDAQGTVRWMSLSSSVLARTRPDQVLKAVDDLGPEAATAQP